MFRNLISVIFTFVLLTHLGLCALKSRNDICNRKLSHLESDYDDPDEKIFVRVYRGHKMLRSNIDKFNPGEELVVKLIKKQRTRDHVVEVSSNARIPNGYCGSKHRRSTDESLRILMPKPGSVRNVEIWAGRWIEDKGEPNLSHRFTLLHPSIRAGAQIDKSWKAPLTRTIGASLLLTAAVIALGYVAVRIYALRFRIRRNWELLFGKDTYK